MVVFDIRPLGIPLYFADARRTSPVDSSPYLTRFVGISMGQVADEDSPHHSQPGQFEFDIATNFKPASIAFMEINDEQRAL